MRRCLAAVAVTAALVALAVPGTAPGSGKASARTLATTPVAVASRLCHGVTARRYRTSRIRTAHVTCTSAREKLERWLRRGHLPRHNFGWYCGRTAPRSSKRICAYGNGGGAAWFRFRLARR